MFFLMATNNLIFFVLLKVLDFVSLSSDIIPELIKYFFKLYLWGGNLCPSVTRILCPSVTIFFLPNPYYFSVFRNSGYYPSYSYTSLLYNATNFSVICQLCGCYLVS